MAEPSSADEGSSRSAADWVADLCVYAPIGFLLDAHKYVPEFAEKGRNQVAMARFIGSFAVGRIEKRLGPALDGAGAPLRALLDGLGLRLPPPVKVDDQPADGGATVPAAGATRDGTDGTGGARDRDDPGGATGGAEVGAAAPSSSRRKSATAASRSKSARSSTSRPARSMTGPASKPKGRRPVRPVAPSTSPGADDAPAESDLAIPQYSTLAASQVVPRLVSLDVHELAAIRRFESDHRGRRTILNRVDQLLARTS